MTEIQIKKIQTKYGKISYYRIKSNKKQPLILFLHGLGENKDWFPKQYISFQLEKFDWIVPDLIGFGDSAKPSQIEAYKMDNQAQFLIHLLIEEITKKQLLIILAHSMGGPIAISIIEKLVQLKDSKIKPACLFYLEGNLDKNDTFYSSQIAKHTFDEYKREFGVMLDHILEKPAEYPAGYYDKVKNIGPFPLWASSIDIVSVSESNKLLPRLQQHLDFPVYFVFGEKNKNRFTSEGLIKKTKLPLVYIPKTGHFMHLENPEYFWKIITELIESSNF